jgi:hypothetical protein
MQVTAAPVLNNKEKVLFPPHLGLNLSPLKGVIITNSLLQVAMEIVHKLRINCRMMLGACMRDVISLMREKPAAVPVDLFHFDHCCWSHRPIGTSLSVSAKFIFMDSLLAFFLGVVLDFAIEAVFPIPIGVVSRLELSVTWLSS